jgi:DNA-binding HxlR family transcriptional regulator
MIIRDAFDGIRRFSQFQRNLGLAKNILSSRLHDLVEAGILQPVPASDGSAYQEYVLTDKGEDLFDIVLGLRQWGEAHAFARGEPHATLVDARTDQPIPRLGYRTPEGRPVHARETRVHKIEDQPIRRGRQVGNG